MTICFDTAAKKLRSYDVSSYLDDAEKDGLKVCARSTPLRGLN